MAEQMSEAQELARDHMRSAQKQQKINYDHKARPLYFLTGRRIFLCKPAEKMREAQKLAMPYHSSYQTIELTVNNAQIRITVKSHDQPIQVALDK